MGKHDVEITPAERAEVLEAARTLAKEFAVAGPSADAENRFPTELVPPYKDSGLPSIAIPKKYGGLGADIATTAEVSRELAKGDPAIAVSHSRRRFVRLGNCCGV